MADHATTCSKSDCAAKLSSQQHFRCSTRAVPKILRASHYYRHVPSAHVPRPPGGLAIKFYATSRRPRVVMTGPRASIIASLCKAPKSTLFGVASENSANSAANTQPDWFTPWVTSYAPPEVHNHLLAKCPCLVGDTTLWTQS